MSLSLNNVLNAYETIDIYTYFQHCGITDVREYLNPTGKYNCNPMGYTNIRDGINLFKYHLLNNSVIGILTDSDFDGYASASLVFKYIKLYKKGIKVKFYIHKGKERGLDDDEIYNKILSDKIDLLIIPDAGSTKTNKEQSLLDNGTDLLVLDHHDADEYIDVGVLINNRLDTNVNIDRDLSGCGVVYTFLKAMDNELNVKFSQHFIDLVGLSVLSDSMPLNDYENRYYVEKLLSLESLHNRFLYELVYQYCNKDRLSTKDISWIIIPKINAVIRSDDMQMKQKVLGALSGLNGSSYETIAKECGEFHKEQYEYVNNFINRNLDKAMIGDNIIILLSDEIKRSYSGLVAGNISGRFNNRPTIVGKLNKNTQEAIGSFRGDYIDRLTLSQQIGVNWANGHDVGAFGVDIDGTKVRELFDSVNSLKIDHTDYIDVLQTIPLNNLNDALFGEFEPLNDILGKGLLTTSFGITNIKVNPKDIKILGVKKDTIKIISNNGIEIMFFKVSKERLQNDFNIILDEDGTLNYTNNDTMNITVIGKLSINAWRGKKTKQIIVEKYDILTSVFN